MRRERREAERNLLIDTLLSIYDEQMKHFGQDALVSGQKAGCLMKYRAKDAELAYDLYAKAFEGQQNNSSLPVLAGYIKCAVLLFTESKKVSKTDVIDVYVKTLGAADAKLSAEENRNKVKRIERTKYTIDSYFARSGAADCNTLIDIYSKQFEATPKDVLLLKRIVETLTKTGCVDCELYLKTLKQLLDIEASAQTAVLLARAVLKKNEFESAALYAKKAIEIDPQFGEAYIIVGLAYAGASETVGKTPFEKKAIFWAAVDKFEEALEKDGGVIEDADMYLGIYTEKFPDEELCKSQNLAQDDAYKIGGWIDETTKVRF